MIRLFVSSPLKENQVLSLNEKQVHYLFHVMRMKSGGRILLFNGIDGEFLAALTEISKSKAIACCLEKTRSQQEEKSLDVWLCFAPIKKDNMDFIVQKATELGVDVLWPILTTRSVCKPNIPRMKMQVIEAAEQCERLSVPLVKEPIQWELFLENFPEDRTLYYLSERSQGCSSVSSKEKVSFFVGPEGGFDERELEILSSKPFAVCMHLGRRILRAETACIVSLACFNQFLNWET